MWRSCIDGEAAILKKMDFFEDMILPGVGFFFFIYQSFLRCLFIRNLVFVGGFGSSSYLLVSCFWYMAILFVIFS